MLNFVLFFLKPTLAAMEAAKSSWVECTHVSSTVSGDLFTMSQMNHLLKINMIYICPRGLLHDVIAALTSHFIVVVSDVLQIFARCVKKNSWVFLTEGW